MASKVLYRTYRDESGLSPLEKVAALARQYVVKMGEMPTVIGIPPSFPEDARAKLRERFDVRVVVPAWAVNEIWLGVGETFPIAPEGQHV